MIANFLNKYLCHIFLAVSLLCVGLFHEAYACFAGVALAVLLIINHIRRGKTVIRLNLCFAAVAVMALFYGLSSFWAVDSGMALIGFFKFLPVLFFLLLANQGEEKERLIFSLPYIAAGVAVLSVLLSFIPAFGDDFLVAGRLAGFFQYPNTFAAFILVGELLLVSREKFRRFDWVVALCLIAAFIYTGSRTAYVVALVANIIALLATKPRKQKALIFATAVALCAVGLGILFAVGEGSAILRRFQSFSFMESTFLGRLLYYKDSLGTILSHPFGLGYKGYYFVQPSIQSGVYSVAFIHNDLLQIMLDIGWAPAILLAAAAIKAIFFSKISMGRRIALGALCAHSLFEFNLQFVAVFFVFALLCDDASGKEIVAESKAPMAIGLALLGAASIYVGLGTSLCRIGQNELSYKIMPWYTDNEIVMITQCKDIAEANAMADKLLARNDRSFFAYSVKARYFYSQGDFGQMIAFKRIALEYAPFQYDEYEDYAEMLINGINLYSKAGDMGSVEICARELIRLRERLHSLENRMSSLGKMIKDQPVLSFPQEIEDYISRLEMTD